MFNSFTIKSKIPYNTGEFAKSLSLDSGDYNSIHIKNEKNSIIFYGIRTSSSDKKMKKVGQLEKNNKYHFNILKDDNLIVVTTWDLFRGRLISSASKNNIMLKFDEQKHIHQFKWFILKFAKNISYLDEDLKNLLVEYYLGYKLNPDVTKKIGSYLESL